MFEKGDIRGRVDTIILPIDSFPNSGIGFTYPKKAPAFYVGWIMQLGEGLIRICNFSIARMYGKGYSDQFPNCKVY